VKKLCRGMRKKRATPREEGKAAARHTGWESRP
jgi:hypothetical protein